MESGAGQTKVRWARAFPYTPGPCPLRSRPPRWARKGVWLAACPGYHTVKATSAAAGWPSPVAVTRLLACEFPTRGGEALTACGWIASVRKPNAITSHGPRTH